MNQGKYMKKHTPENTKKMQKTNQHELPKIYLKSIKNRRLGRCLPAGLQNMDFGGPGWISRFPGVPPRAKIDKKVEKTALPNA